MADLQTAGMDNKLLVYVHQADRVMKKYLEEAQAPSIILLNDDLLGALYDNDDKKFGKDLEDIEEGEEEEVQDYPVDFVDNSDAEDDDDDEVVAYSILYLGLPFRYLGNLFSLLQPLWVGLLMSSPSSFTANWISLLSCPR